MNSKSSHHDAVLTNLLDKRISSTVVGDCQTESRSILQNLKPLEKTAKKDRNLNLDSLCFTLHVGKQEVIKTDLTAQQA